jgi:hypothetical protein
MFSFWIIWFLARWGKPRCAVGILVVVFCYNAFLHGDYHFPRARDLGSKPNEKALIALRDNFEPGSKVISYNKREILAAEMKSVSMKLGLHGINDAIEMGKWLKGGHARGIYVDQFFMKNEPLLWNMIKQEIGKTLKTVHVSEDRSIVVLRIVGE